MKNQIKVLLIFGAYQNSTYENLFFRSLSLFFILLCSYKSKYKYIETVKEESLSGDMETKEKDAKVISAGTDSAAYCDAYLTYCVAQKVAMDMKKQGLKYISTPVSFKLLNQEGEDITYTTFF